jgi:hypothetical protein
MNMNLGKQVLVVLRCCLLAQFTAQADSYGPFTHRCRNAHVVQRKATWADQTSIKSILPSIMILILTFPCNLPAQEPRTHSRTFPADSELPSAAGDRLIS